MADIHVRGLNELAIKLKALPEKIARKHMQKAVNMGADVTKAAAKAKVPTSTEGHRGNPPGYLKTQIRRRAANRGLGKFARGAAVGVLTDEKKGGLIQRSGGRKTRGKNSVDTGLTGFANSDAYYWRFVEFGTSKMGARPFIRPAHESTINQQIDKVKSVLRDGLYKEANKL